MIKKILIANRGEIAVRIAQAAAAMGITSCALYTQDDEGSRHWQSADEAILLEGKGASAFLDSDDIIKIAKAQNCDAIHPGYGLLSENADFARACEQAGLIFIGPKADTLIQLGDKIAARQLAKQQNIPIIEGETDPRKAAAFFASLKGDAMLVKAAAGGGGRGMRIIEQADDIASHIRDAQSEAEKSFGDGTLYMERFLPEARHIEVQIIGDGKNVTHAWERDCSLQRRHQKIIELAPAPHLSEALRKKLLADSVKLAKAARYHGVGTMEFLLTPEGAYYFIECNPRLQVEHCITEQITGLDLVQTQILLAAGETLATLDLQSPPPCQGQSIQLRLCAETMRADGMVLPAAGVIEQFNPPMGRDIRLESHIQSGMRTNPFFDSLLAKIIISQTENNLPRLLAQTRRAAQNCRLDGVKHNLSFLYALLAHQKVESWQVSTRFIEAHLPELLAGHDALQPNQKDNAKPATTTKEIHIPANSEAVNAPLQALLLEIHIGVNDNVKAGDELVIFEAMKMHHVVTAPFDGIIRGLPAKIGEVVDADAPILFIERTGESQDHHNSAKQVDLDHIRSDLAEFQSRVDLTLDAARPDKMQKRHDMGYRSARENIADLCDENSFMEYGQFIVAAQRTRRDIEDLKANTPADGMVAGFGSVNGDAFAEDVARIAVLAYDYTVLAGTQGAFNHKKTDRILELASEWKIPSVFFTEGGGGRPGDTDMNKITGAGLEVMTFATYAAASATAPRIAINNGYCFAGNAVLFGSADVTIATRASSIGMGGPAMIEGGGLGVFHPDDIGPMDVQSQNGVVDLLVENEAEAVFETKKLLAFFQGAVATWDCADQRKLRHMIPEDRKRVYDIREAIALIADTGSVQELRRDYGVGMLTGFLRIEGKPFGYIANNPFHLGGAIDAAAAEKAARFMQLCDAFDLPLISFCDTPGFMVGPEHEKEATVRRASSMMVVGASLDIPVFMICLRKGYGLGAQAMAMGSFNVPNFTIAWPTGEFGPMGLEGAVQLGYAKELAAQESPEARDALYDKLVASMYEKGKALSVAMFQEIDAVIDPKETRSWLLKGLATMPVGRKQKAKKRPFIDVW